VSDEHREFLRKLPPHERTLLVLREELYEGSWDEMKVDLELSLMMFEILLIQYFHP